MPTEDAVGNIFKTLTDAVLWEHALIMLVTLVLILALQHLIPWVANRLPGRKRLLVLSIAPYFRLVIILVAIAFIVPRIIEPSLQNMIAILGSLGIALGFALKDYASGLIAGIVAIGELNYRNGDWVQLGDVYGEVRHIGLRTVEIVTPDDNRVLVPHSYLWNQPVSNANNGDASLQCAATFYLHPNHNGKQVQHTLENIALTSPYLNFNHPIAVLVKEQPWGTEYTLKAYPVEALQQFRFISDLTLRGKSALQDLNIQFAATLSSPANNN